MPCRHAPACPQQACRRPARLWLVIPVARRNRLPRCCRASAAHVPDWLRPSLPWPAASAGIGTPCSGPPSMRLCPACAACATRPPGSRAAPAFTAALPRALPCPAPARTSPRMRRSALAAGWMRRPRRHQRRQQQTRRCSRRRRRGQRRAKSLCRHLHLSCEQYGHYCASFRYHVFHQCLLLSVPVTSTASSLPCNFSLESAASAQNMSKALSALPTPISLSASITEMFFQLTCIIPPRCLIGLDCHLLKRYLPLLVCDPAALPHQSGSALPAATLDVQNKMLFLVVGSRCDIS